MKPLDVNIRAHLGWRLSHIEEGMEANVVTIISPIISPLDHRVRDALDQIDVNRKRDRLVVILDTPGGVVDVAERMVTTIRSKYNEVFFVVPDQAMSAGTVLVMSGDKIFMDDFSCLGPIDPQFERDGHMFPVTSYLNHFEKLNEKSKSGDLTTVEYGLLMKLDLGELEQWEQARELSIELLETWLSKYKFKDWTETETQKKPVNDEMKKVRAHEIGEKLSDTTRWHTHGRGINKETLELETEVNLRIDDFTVFPELNKHIRPYFNLLKDYFTREEYLMLLHTKEVFDGFQVPTRFNP